MFMICWNVPCGSFANCLKLKLLERVGKRWKGKNGFYTFFASVPVSTTQSFHQTKSLRQRWSEFGLRIKKTWRSSLSRITYSLCDLGWVANLLQTSFLLFAYSMKNYARMPGVCNKDYLHVLLCSFASSVIRVSWDSFFSLGGLSFRW